MIIHTNGINGEAYRHPLTYMLEAADDIAYATADLEDAFKKKLFTLDDFIQYFEQSYTKEEIIPHKSPAFYSDTLIQKLQELRGPVHTVAGDWDALKTWLNYTRRWLMYVAVYRFSYKYREIMSGTYGDDLFKETNHSLTIEILKKQWEGSPLIRLVF